MKKEIVDMQKQKVLLGDQKAESYNNEGSLYIEIFKKQFEYSESDEDEHKYLQ